MPSNGTYPPTTIMTAKRAQIIRLKTQLNLGFTILNARKSLAQSVAELTWKQSIMDLNKVCFDICRAVIMGIPFMFLGMILCHFMRIVFSLDWWNGE